MKRRIIAALMALCLCIGLLPATALAVDTPSESHYVTVNYDDGVMERNITVNVYNADGNLVDTVYINDAKVAAHRITISLTEQYETLYDIEDVSHPDSAGTFTNKNVSRDSCSFDTTGAEGSNMIVSVQLCPEFEPPEIVNEHDDWYELTLEYRLYEPQMLELLYLNGDTDVNTKTTVSNIDVRFVDSYGILEDANLNSLPTGANNLPYRYMTLSDVGDKGNPNNIRYLEITYDNNDGSGEKTVRIYSGDLRYVGTEVDSRPVYEIEASDDPESIVAFYIEEGAELSTWSLYDVEFVKDGEALGYDRMPEDPTFPNTQYVFTNWDKNVTGGAPFLPYDPVTDHTVVYAQKTSTSGYGGTEYHAMNTGNALLDRFLELYNTNHNTEYGLNDIDLDSVKIQVNGLDSDATNPNYWNNHWKNNNAYYRIVNSTINLGWQSDTVSNTHVPHEQAQSITIYADVDGTSVEVVIPCGTNPGEIGKSRVQDNIVQLIVNAPPTAPDDEDLTDDPDDPDDTAILGEGAVTVDCINNKAEHDPVTYGLIPGSYTALTDEDVYWANDAEGNGAYYVDITVQDDLYVEAYNRDDDVDVTHRITGEDTKTITLKWVDSSWEVDSDVPVTFTVTCDDEVGDGYTLTYNYNQGGGSTTFEPAGQTYAANESADLPEKISTDIDTDKDGVVFVGWTEKPNNYTKSTPATVEPTGMVTSVIFSDENIIVHAVWAQDANNDDIPDYEDDNFAMQNVYVYAKPIGSGTDGALTEPEKKILEETYGLTLNAKGYCVLGKLENVLLPLASQQNIGQNYYNDSNYADVIQAAFAAGKFKPHNSAADHQDLIKTLDWYHLGVASGADGYENEAPSSGLCWHLDGNLDISAKYKLTYDANGGTIDGNEKHIVNDITTEDPENYTLDTTINPTHANEGTEDVLFAGWTTDGSAQDQIYSVEDAKNGSVPAAVDAVDLIETKTVYALWSYDEDNDGTPDINEIIVTPADITIYTGGDSYTGEIVDSKGDPVTSGGEDETQDYNGFPEPGFYITLPTALNDQLRGGTTGPVDLSEELSFVYSVEGQQEKTWNLQMYNPKSSSNIAFSKFVYRMTPAEGQAPVRLQIAGEDGPISDDRLENFGTDNLFETYTMSIYGGDVRTDAVKAQLTINGAIQSCDIYVDSGELTVRGTTASADTVAVNDPLDDANGFQATAESENKYYINGSNIEVAARDVHLLTDELTGGQEQLNQLQEKAEDALTTAGITETDGLTYDFMYLDLVDSSNGNAYVTMQGTHTVTIHWPIPTDADPDGKFYVVHFGGLDRNYTITDGNIPIDDEKIDVYHSGDEDQKLNVNTDVGSVSFKTFTFSPFALVYETTSTPPTPQYTVEFKPGDHGSLLGTTIFHVNAGDSVISVPTVNENSNYDFTVWLGSDNKTYSKNDILSLEINSNMTFTAQYRYTGDSGYDPKEATLRFNSRGGTEFDDIVRDDPFEYNPYNKIPSRPGYRFTGWYDSSRLDNRYDEDEEISVPMGITTVWAGWEETSVPSMLNGDDHYAYIQGYSDGTVRPNANITRAQVATIFFRLLDEDVRDDNLTTYNTFPDVDEDYWANTAISTMASLGVINGRNSGLFDPDAYITRAEFAAICARFDDSGVDGITTFTDTVGHWAEDEISRAAALGWIQGYSDGTFRPNQYITRAQAVTMINRVLCRLPEDTDDLLSGMNTWTDCHEDDWFYLAIQEATNSHDFVAKDRVYESWTDLNRAPDWSRYE